MQRHVWRTRRIYEARRDHCVRELRSRLSDVVDFTVPPGGLGLWTTVKRDVPVAAWHIEAARRGALIQPGSLFTFAHRDVQHVRIGHCGVTEKELSTAVERLLKAADVVRHRPIK